MKFRHADLAVSVCACRRAFHLSVNGNLTRNQLKSLTSKLRARAPAPARDTFDVCGIQTLKAHTSLQQSSPCLCF